MDKITTSAVCFMLTLFFSISTIQFNTASATSLYKQTITKKKLKKNTKKRRRHLRLTGCHNLSRSRLNSKAKRFRHNIKSAARKYKVNPNLIKAVITTESCFNPRARGSSGEKGLMQLMDATGKRFNIRNRYNPRQNIQGGTKYLSYLLKRYGGSKRHAVAAYNTGEGRIRRNGYIPNKAYVYKVMFAYQKFNRGKLNTAQYKSFRHRHRNKRKAASYPHRRNQKTYLIKPGDSLSKIAKQQAVSKRKLIRFNRLKYPYRLKAGKKIYLKKYTKKHRNKRNKAKIKISKKTRKGRYKKSHYSKNRNKRSRSKRKYIRPVKRNRRKFKRYYYVVRSGDTLYSIMRKTHVSVRQLIYKNKLRKPFPLSVKQRLRLK